MIYDQVQHDHPATTVPEHDRSTRMTLMNAARHDARAVARAIGRVGPLLEAIAENPQVDELVDYALEAARLGVADEVFHAAVAVLGNASSRARQQPAPADPAATSAELPAVTGTPDGTGPQQAADSGQA